METYILSQPLPLANGLNPQGKRENMMSDLKKAERPEVVHGSTWCIPTGCGKLYVVVNRLEGRIFEVFLKGGKAGGCMTAQTEAIGKFISEQARYGLPIDDDFVKKFKGTSCQEKPKEGKAQSCADAMARVIEKDIALYKESQPIQIKLVDEKEKAYEDNTDDTRS